MRQQEIFEKHFTDNKISMNIKTTSLSNFYLTVHHPPVSVIHSESSHMNFPFDTSIFPRRYRGRRRRNWPGKAAGVPRVHGAVHVLAARDLFFPKASLMLGFSFGSLRRLRCSKTSFFMFLRCFGPFGLQEFYLGNVLKPPVLHGFGVRRGPERKKWHVEGVLT